MRITQAMLFGLSSALAFTATTPARAQPAKQERVLENCDAGTARSQALRINCVNVSVNQQDGANIAETSIFNTQYPLADQRPQDGGFMPNTIFTITAPKDTPQSALNSGINLLGDEIDGLTNPYLWRRNRERINFYDSAIVVGDINGASNTLTGGDLTQVFSTSEIPYVRAIPVIGRMDTGFTEDYKARIQVVYQFRDLIP